MAVLIISLIILIMGYISILVFFYWVCYLYINSEFQEKRLSKCGPLRPLFRKMDNYIEVGRKDSNFLNGTDVFMESSLKNPFFIFFSIRLKVVN